MKHITGNLKAYLFSPRFHFSRFQFNLISVALLSVGLLAGIYVTLAKVFPDVFALNDTENTWTFNTANASSYTYDSTLVAVDTSAHPISTANRFTNPAFASNNTGWSVAAVPPTGWVEVPGNSTYGTTNFLAMKYEAKCAATSAPTVGLTTPDTGSHTLANNTTACTSANSRQVVSVASGYPIANISQTDSATYCSAVSLNGNAAHLQNNNEWMTMARDAEAQAGNWTGGSVGSGLMFRGQTDIAPATALDASTDDTNGYYGTGNSSSSSPEQKRTLTLSNGSVIWDLPGNVWEWTNNTIQGKDEPSSASPGFAWREFTALTTYGTLTYDQVRPLNTAYNSSYSVGQIYSDGTSSNTTIYAFYRGGNWSYGSDAGAFAAALNLTPTNSGNHIGFRCASDPVAISQSFSSSSGRGAAGGDSVTVGSISDAKIYQSINVGDTSAYDISAYVYDNTTGNVGGTVSSSIAQLYANGATVTTTYTSVGSGWWKLTGTVTGVASSVQYGVLVKAGKTVVVDDFTLSKSGTYSVYTTNAYSNAQVNTWDTFCEGTLVGSTCTTDATYSGNSAIKYQLCTDDGATCQSGNSWKYWTGSAWAAATDTSTTVNTAAQLTQAAMQTLPIVTQKISVKAIFSFGGADSPTMPHISIGFTTDTTAPTTNASALAMTRSNGGTTVASNGWTNNTSPYFSWTAGADNAGGSGLKGYCLYLGTDSTGDPATAKGLLGTSPVSTAGTTCQFIVSATSIDFATASYKGSTWLTTSSSPYYMNIKAIDNSGNVFIGSSAQFQFRFDNTTPTNVAYISPASGNFSNVVDMNFAWPTSGSSASSDSNAGILGWQYQINSTSGTWLGTTTDSTLGVNYIPTSASSYTLTQSQDGASIVSGTNVIYFRTVDAAGNVSSDATIRTGSISFGGAAPTFGGSDSVTVTPSTSTSNSYALSWPAATPTSGKTVAHYYYMINVSPPSTLATLQGTATTYIDNGTNLSVSAAALANVTKGTNTVYVVAIDNATTPNYSPSNYIKGTFTLNSTNPDPVQSLVASDSSIKDKSQWNVTLTWAAPSYQGAGNLTYKIYRSTDDVTFASVGTTSGLSYVDNTPSSTLYYYYVVTLDGASATSSNSSTVSITPTGRYTSAPSLQTNPSAGSITTQAVTITWSTDRSADSKVEYGTTSGSYNTTQPYVSNQVTSHSVTINNLSAGTTYYYKTQWTDADGNTGTSDEYSFSTTAAPSVSAVSAGSIGLTTAYINFTISNGSSANIQYGPTTAYGGSVTQSTSNTSSGSTYSVPLTSLADGTQYHYRIVMADASGNTYNSDDYTDLVTLPRPKITNVRIQQVANTAQTTLFVTWTTNTAISSIVTTYPVGNPGAAADTVNVALTSGAHQMIVGGMLPKTDYYLVVKGRDKIGNEAASDSQKVTTATDTRPPAISDLHVEGSNVPPVGSTAQAQTAQLIVSWNTDEPGSSQVEFGEGTGESYNQKTQQDENLTMNHLVVISGLTPSKVYHLRAISLDAAKNVGSSIDTVTITPKATENALNLVITNLQQAFGFLGGLGQ
jgi:formylglycine-generating enzyme required for sulfatase activity